MFVIHLSSPVFGIEENRPIRENKNPAEGVKSAGVETLDLAQEVYAASATKAKTHLARKAKRVQKFPQLTRSQVLTIIVVMTIRLDRPRKYTVNLATGNAVAEALAQHDT